MVQATSPTSPLFVPESNWVIQFDMDGAAAEATRRKIYDMARAEKMMVQGFHYPFRRSATSRRPAPAIG